MWQAGGRRRRSNFFKFCPSLILNHPRSFILYPCDIFDMLRGTLCKLLQRQTYDVLSHRWGTLAVLVAFLLLLASAFQFGEMMYAVIKFEETNEYEAVPRSWVKDGVCWWPGHLKASALRAALKKRAPPEPEWDTYSPVTILKEKDNYSKARNACRKAVQNLDLATTDDNSKRKSHPPKNRKLDDSDDNGDGSDDDDDDDDGDDGSNSPVIAQQKSPHIERKQQKTTQGTSKGKRPASLPALSNLPLLSDHVEERVASTPTSRRLGRDPASVQETRDKKVLVEIGILKGMVRSNTILLKSIIDKQTPHADSEMNIDEFHLPLTTEDDVASINCLLENKEKRRSLVRYLCSLGGLTPKEVIGRMMTEIMSNTLATQYNWLGKGSKMGLKSLHLANVIKEAAKGSNLTESQAEEAIKKWLKYANDRDGGRKRRLLKKKAEKKKESERTKTEDTVLESSSDLETSDAVMSDHSHSSED